MSRLLPGATGRTADPDGDPRLLCIDDETTAEVLSVLSSDRSQAVFRRLHREPSTAKDIASDLGTSVQGVSYHLNNLEEVGLIDVVDTCYSEKGAEMDVYGPAGSPHLLFLGREDDWSRLRGAFTRLAATVGPIGWLSAVGGTVAELLGSTE